jgi:hypothetical protein
VDFSFGGLPETLAIQQWRWGQWRKLNPETAVWVDHHNDDGGVGQCDRDGRTGISGADGSQICRCERADNKVAIGVIPELLGPGSALHRKPGPAHRRLKAGESRQASATAAASPARRRSVRQPGREGFAGQVDLRARLAAVPSAQEPLGGAFVIGREGDTGRGSCREWLGCDRRPY